VTKWKGDEGNGGGSEQESSGMSPGSWLAILVGGVKARRASTAVTGAARGLLKS
jgi:hypothetical protein